MGQESTLLLGMPAPLAWLLILALLGLGLILAALLMLMRRKADPLERLNAARPTPNAAAAAATAASTGGQAGRLRQGRGNDKLHKYATFLEPKDAQQMSEIRTKLLQAGYRSRAAVRYFNFAQFVLGLAGLALGAGYYLLAAAKGAEMGMQETLLYILGPGGVGYLTPRYWATKRQQERQKEIQANFSDLGYSGQCHGAFWCGGCKIYCRRRPLCLGRRCAAGGADLHGQFAGRLSCPSHGKAHRPAGTGPRLGQLGCGREISHGPALGHQPDDLSGHRQPVSNGRAKAARLCISLRAAMR